MLGVFYIYYLRINDYNFTSKCTFTRRKSKKQNNTKFLRKWFHNNLLYSIKTFELCFQLAWKFLVLCSMLSQAWRQYLKTALVTMLISCNILGRSLHLPNIQCQMDEYRWMDRKMLLLLPYCARLCSTAPQSPG